jgi:hypothetical protein
LKRAVEFQRRINALRQTVLKQGSGDCPVARVNPLHLEKQTAVGSLLLASFAIKNFGDLFVAEVPMTEAFLSNLTKAFNESEEGQLCHSAWGLTFDRRPSWTPVHAQQRIVSINQLCVRLGSRLGADRGSNRKPIHMLIPQHLA